ncbi:hypothetical protein [Chitinophaga sp. CF418]|uniref:hypothetical protein n=1 Tax=Chitinophaga sp. CF418 TaxID=1855287 RepID=UPI0009133073|nr:hypothetical protein [Chitinophaga sp. CF418]SHN45506.1 hypothetical protein SAMN05216311_12081 [Chitinophaga sp. CF418]
MIKPQDPRIAITAQIIKELRIKKLNNGHCFLIFDDELPEVHSYYEYPDGRIQIEEVDITNIYNPREVIRVLSEDEADSVRARHAVFH